MNRNPVPAPLSTTNEATPSKGGWVFFGGIRGRRLPQVELEHDEVQMLQLGGSGGELLLVQSLKFAEGV